MNRNERLRQQCERQVANKDGVNYAQARASYGREVADAIFHDSRRKTANASSYSHPDSSPRTAPLLSRLPLSRAPVPFGH